MISNSNISGGPFTLNSVYEKPQASVGEDSPESELATALEEASRSRSEAAEQLLDLLQGTGGAEVMKNVDSVLDLGSGRNLLGRLGQLSREELAESFEILSDLFARGIVGYETREINGEPQKVFIDVAIGSDAHRAPLVKDRGDRFDRYV